MVELQSFAARDIGGRDRLEDYVLTETVETAGGLTLEVIMACDGAGGGDAGEQAARLTSRTVVDYLEVSEITNIPRLMVEAVEEANRVVYSELRGSGTSTIAMAVIDINDGEHGRAFIASVGDSRIYLIRRQELVRLNIDHTLANEYIYAGQMSANEAARLENADATTRIIGINPDIQVDIGFYVERGNPFVNAQRAFNIGKRGMLLKDGDTVFAATEGMFNAGNESGGGPVVRDTEFLKHGMDDDVERAARALLRYGNGRGPKDNVSIAMTFVPSRFRRAVRTTRLNRWQVATVLSLVGVLILFGVQLFRQQQDLRDQRRLVLQATQLVIDLSATATFTPTATATSTPTTTPTATIPPTRVDEERQAAFQYFSGTPEPLPILINRLAPSDSLRSLFIVDGPRFDPNLSDTANMYVQPESQLEFLSINGSVGEETVTNTIYSGSDVYVRSGSFVNGSVNFGLDRFTNVDFRSQAQCFAFKQIPPDPEDVNDFDKLALTCFDSVDGVCSYTLPDEPPVTMPNGKRVLLNLEQGTLVTSDEDPIYEEIKVYYDTVVELSGGDADAVCLSPFLDVDGDGILYPVDACETQFGTEITEGCPDSDGDSIRDSLDACVNEFGLVDFDGCPPPTATPIPDADGDGLEGALDECPFEFGPPDNNGCPVPEVPASY
ncbi:MAG: hypothetical protein AAFR56_16635 [Chloroflexota bacterium]